MPIRKYGLIRSTQLESLPAYKLLGESVVSSLPVSVDLRPTMPPVYDQGQTSSCTANAISGAMQFVAKTNITPSRMFIYYNERVPLGETSSDSGASLDIGVQTTKQYGACPETEWDFETAHITEKPDTTCYQNALKFTLESFEIVNSVEQIKHSLSLGFPVAAGMIVYESFESEQTAQTGQLTIPLPTEQCLGGHAVVIVGYNDLTQQFIVRNSWGEDWGMKGYFQMPYAYAQNPQLCFDWISIQKVGIETPLNQDVPL